jgi:hypothetical protein
MTNQSDEVHDYDSTVLLTSIIDSEEIDRYNTQRRENLNKKKPKRLSSTN